MCNELETIARALGFVMFIGIFFKYIVVYCKILFFINLSCLYRGELTKAFIISELVELTNDEELIVRLAAIETVANLLQLLDDGKDTR
jgi:hypothetical protein